jgi:hypothetical protein
MSTAKRKIILKKLSAFNTVWHPDSGLVFKSQKERLVIGSYVDNNIVDLDENSLALCEEWNFKPDESLFVNEEEGEEQQEEASESAGEEQQEEASESAGEEKEKDQEEASESAGEEQQEEASESAGEEQEEEASESAGEKEQSIHKENVIESNISEVCSKERSNIQPHLIKFHKDVDILSKDLASTLTPLFVDLQTKIMQLEKDLKQKTRDNEELQSKYNAMDQKFKTMKSLFS